MISESLQKFFDANFDRMSKLHGRCRKLIVPSGVGVIIREQNGEDDDTLSNVAEATKGNSFNNFVQSIVVAHQAYPNGLTPEDVLDMLLRDKYYILLASRIHSLGAIVKFPWKWDDIRSNTNYEENLNRYFWDFYKNEGLFPTTEDEAYSVDLIPPYPKTLESNVIELTLSSGKEVMFHLANGHSEAYLLTLEEGKRNKNSELRARGFSIKAFDQYQPVQNFKAFSTKDMQEVRAKLEEVDADTVTNTEITHPAKPSKVVNLNIFTIIDFFFPAGV